MKDLDLFKKRFLSYDKQYILIVEDDLILEALNKKPFLAQRLSLGDKVYLVMIQKLVHDDPVMPEYSLSPESVREADLPRLMREFYYLRKLPKSGVPVFSKRVFPEFILDSKENTVLVDGEDTAATILRKVFDVLGCGALSKAKKYVDDAKECNNRITELNVWYDKRTTAEIIADIFSDYVTVKQKEVADYLIEEVERSKKS